jgi:hypothetical protein
LFPLATLGSAESNLMNILLFLQQQLNDQNNTALAEQNFGSGQVLDRELGKLKSWLGGGSDPVAAAPDKIVTALKAFYQTQKLNNFAQTRLICYGCTQTLDPNNKRLIEDRPQFKILMHAVENYRNRPVLFRRCYRGLLNGYFSYDHRSETCPPSGVENWLDLRTFLDKWKGNLYDKGHKPEWITALDEHPNILSAEPCQRYGDMAIQGDQSAFDDIRNRLAISDDSWLIRSIVDAQIAAAIKYSDTEFKRFIDSLLKLLSEHNLLIDSGLSKIINRYANCSERRVHEGLRDFAVAQWRNPWLSLNAARWGSVTEDARKMVAGWLKEKLIAHFFSLLAEDGANDRRRVTFWQQYSEDISDMYFALGKQALARNSVDFKKMREDMDGRILKLINAGSPTNNAFIMIIGNNVIVEFGTIGNAAFIFDKRMALPFKLESNTQVAADADGLKNRYSPSFVGRLIHNGSWEGEFSATLRKLGVSPTALRPDTTPTNTWIPIKNSGDEIAQGIQQPSVETFSEAALHRFAQKNKLAVQDMRRLGGRLWILTKLPLEGDNLRILKHWNFSWSETRGGYYLEIDHDA